MSRPNKKTPTPLAPSSKSKNNKSKSDKSKKIDRDIDDFIIEDQQFSSEQQQRIKPKMKRLKKQKLDSSDEQELMMEDNNSDDEWDAQGQNQQVDQLDFQRYALVDDEDLQKQKQEEDNKKKKKKLKGNHQIDKYMNKVDNKNSKKKDKKAQSTQVQMNILSMLKNNKQKKRKVSSDDQFANIEIDEDISNISEMKDQQKISAQEKRQIQQAIKRSKKQLENQQSKIYQKVKKSNTKQQDQDQRFKKQMQEALKASIQQQQQQQRQAHLSKQSKNNKKRPKSANKKSKKQDKNIKQGPLSGFQIAMSCQFQPYKKGKLIELVQQLGAKHPKSLTKKATHLFLGCYVADAYGRRLDQDPNNVNKVKQAKQRGVPIITNDQLDDFFIKYTGKSLQELVQKEKKAIQQKLNLVDINKTNSKTVVLESQQNGQNHFNDKILWTQKYKPKTLDDIIGQKSQIRQLRQWIEAWEDIHVRGNKREVKGGFNSFLPSGNINSKAALLSGDAGIGKTTTARLLAAQYNYGIVQYNASQSRNKKSVLKISQGTDNLWLSESTINAKTLIIMDEIDGMSSGDRGGITAIIQLIKKTKVPIVCICNDRQSPKIRSLAGHCHDIKYHKPDKTHIVKRLEQILDQEGGTYTHKGLQRLVQMMQNDMRQILTYLQFFFKTVSKQISYDTIQKHPGKAKDNAIMINHFQASKRLMNRLNFQNLKISERIDLAFIDSDFVPLMVHQNYLTTSVKKKMNRDQFRNVVKATESLVDGDILDRKIMRTQNYIAMPNKMFLTSVYPTEMVSQNCGFAKFTNWLGKFSSERKVRRLIKQLKWCLGISSLVTTHSVKHNYSAMIFQWVVNHLKGQNPQIDKIVEFMDFYNISPVILTQNITALQLGAKSDQLKSIPAGNKAKLTRAYNAHHQKITKGKKGKAKTQTNEGIAKYDPVLGQMQFQVMQDQEQNNEEENQNIQEQIKPTKTKAGKSKPKK